MAKFKNDQGNGCRLRDFQFWHPYSTTSIYYIRLWCVFVFSDVVTTIQNIYRSEMKLSHSRRHY